MKASRINECPRLSSASIFISQNKIRRIVAQGEETTWGIDWPDFQSHFSSRNFLLPSMSSILGRVSKIKPEKDLNIL
jgi:hypothetical protein